MPRRYAIPAISPSEPALKPVTWCGDSRAVVKAWADPAKLSVGEQLMIVQLGEYPESCEKLPEVGKDVHCIRVKSEGEEYRVLWLAKIADAVVVLHAFHKKSKKGIANPKTEIALAKQRLKKYTESRSTP